MRFIQQHDLLPELMAAADWKPKMNQLVFNEEVYNPETQSWLREVDYPKKPEPSLQEAYKQFQKIFIVEQKKDSGLIRIIIEHVSPFTAQKWVELLVKDINAEMKKNDIEEALQSKEFLNQELQNTNLSDMRAVLYKLLEEQTKTIMFANIKDEYVFKTVDPAIVAEEKFKPKRAVICILITLFGGVLSCTVIAVRYILRYYSAK